MIDMMLAMTTIAFAISMFVCLNKSKTVVVNHHVPPKNMIYGSTDFQILNPNKIDNIHIVT